MSRWHKAALLGRSGKLSADAAREVISRGVADVYAAANIESLDTATIRLWCKRWLEGKAIEAEDSTHDVYERITKRFLKSLGSKADRDLSTLQAADVVKYRDREAKALSRATANLSLKVLRDCFGEPLDKGCLRSIRRFAFPFSNRVKSRLAARLRFPRSNAFSTPAETTTSGAGWCSSASTSGNGLATWRS